MHIRHLLTATLLVGGLHAGKQDNPSNIPEHEREAYRKCVMYVTSHRMNKLYRDPSNQHMFIDTDVAKSNAHAAEWLRDITAKEPELAEQENGFCAELLNKYMQRNTSWFSAYVPDHIHPREHADIKRDVDDYIITVRNDFASKARKLIEKYTDKDEDNT